MQRRPDRCSLSSSTQGGCDARPDSLFSGTGKRSRRRSVRPAQTAASAVTTVGPLKTYRLQPSPASPTSTAGSLSNPAQYDRRPDGRFASLGSSGPHLNHGIEDVRTFIREIESDVSDRPTGRTAARLPMAGHSQGGRSAAADSLIKDPSNSEQVSGIWAAGQATQTSKSPGGGRGAQKSPSPVKPRTAALQTSEMPSAAPFIEISVTSFVTEAQPEQHDPRSRDSSEIECPNLGAVVTRRSSGPLDQRKAEQCHHGQGHHLWECDETSQHE